MIILNKPMPRRKFLRGAGAALALPFLDAMVPVFGATASSVTTRPTRLSFYRGPEWDHHGPVDAPL